MSERSHRQLLGGMRDLALVKLRKAHQVMTDNAGMSEGMRAHLRAEYEGVRGYDLALGDAVLACLDECPRDVQDAVKVWRAASEALARAA